VFDHWGRELDPDSIQRALGSIDLDAAEGGCPACGARFPTTAKRCPECGLRFG
jgi:predicted amidophosphoribosyltransferase